MGKKEIILSVIDALGIKSINSFAKEIGYANSSGVLNLINEDGRSISEGFISKVVNRYPEVNEKFLRGKSDIVINEALNSATKSTYTLNDMPNLIAALLNEVKELKELVKNNQG